MKYGRKYTGRYKRNFAKLQNSKGKYRKENQEQLRFHKNYGFDARFNRLIDAITEARRNICYN